MGQLIRLLLLIAAIWLAVSLFRRLLASLASTRREAPKTPAAHGGSMRPCAHCGVYVPHDEAVSAHGKLYCSRQHADADR